jgi:uncharacterized protein (TIGR00251 family)
MAEFVTLNVRVTPHSSRDEITGWRGDELRVRLRAVPVDGQANEALRRFLARALEVPPSAVEIVAGATARAKRVRVYGMDDAALRARLEPPRP